MNMVRSAKPSDASRIEALYAQLVSNPGVKVLPERIDAISQDPNTRLFVCEHKDQVEATALVSLCADVMFGFQPFAVIENVIVNSTCRGAGLGSSLLRHIEAFSASKDCSKIMLLSAIQREDAHRFFEKAGFAGSSKRGFVKYRREFRA